MRCLPSALAASTLGAILAVVAGSSAMAQTVSDPLSFTLEAFADVTDPFHISFDEQGNLFVGRDASGSGGSSGAAVAIHMVSPDGLSVSEFGAPIEDPDGVVVDVGGNLTAAGSVLVGSGFFPAAGYTSKITEISFDGTSTSPLVSTLSTEALSNPQQLVFDSTGRLLWANFGAGDGRPRGSVGTLVGGVPTVVHDLGDAILDGIS